MPRAKKTVPTTTDASVDVAPETLGAAAKPVKKYTPDQMKVIDRLAATLLAGTSTSLHPDAVLSRTRSAYDLAKQMLAVSEEVAQEVQSND